jgi:hypothetical protein
MAETKYSVPCMSLLMNTAILSTFLESPVSFILPVCPNCNTVFHCIIEMLLLYEIFHDQNLGA